MKPEDDLLFTCTRQRFKPVHGQKVIQLAARHEIDWEAVLTVSIEHGVAPLVFKNLATIPATQLKIPENIQKKARQLTFRHAIHQERWLQRLEETLHYFSQRGLPVMLLKGAVLNSLVYEHPWYTITKDIDILLKVTQDELPAADFTAIQHYLHRSGIEFDFYAHHDLNINGAIPVDFEQVWHDARRLQFRGHDVLVPSPEDLLISLCINSCRKRYFRLKSLLDITETVALTPELNWEIVLNKARRYDCQAILFTALSISDLTLGVSLPGSFLNRLSLSPLRKIGLRLMIQTLLARTSLSAYPYSGREILGRRFHLSLLLPYFSYRGYQIRHGEIASNRR